MFILIAVYVCNWDRPQTNDFVLSGDYNFQYQGNMKYIMLISGYFE